MPQDVHDLKVWQRAIELAVCIYKLTRGFPREEVYGLVSQMRRAAVSVASNIAEGRGRLGPAEFRHFLGQAQGSLYELRTQILISKRLAIVDDGELHDAEMLCEEISKMLVSLINKLRAHGNKLKAEG